MIRIKINEIESVHAQIIKIMGIGDEEEEGRKEEGRQGMCGFISNHFGGHCSIHL